jgi:hypothetical protein
MDLEDETAVTDPLSESDNDELELDFDAVDDLPEEESLADAPLEPTAVIRLSSPLSRVSLDELVACFAPCGRCGYFLAGYRAALGLANLQTAVSQTKSGWIVLAWNDVVRELVLKSYASDIEENDFHFEGSCPECHRHFIYRAPNHPNQPHTLRMEIRPR